ncbi:MAG: peptidase domain-containing ABC transporter [Geminicoccaceae bacterium]
MPKHVQEEVQPSAAAIEDILSMLRRQQWLGVSSDGSACLSAYLPLLLSGLGWSASVDRVVLAMPHKPSGIDLVDLLNTMGHLGLPAAPMRQSLHHLDQRLLPLVFVPEGPYGQKTGPLLVVAPNDSDTCKEPTFYQLQGDDLSPITPPKRLFGTAYIFRKRDDQRSDPNVAARRATGAGWFRTTVGRFRSTLSQIFMISLIINFASLATPVFVMLVYDVIIGDLTTYGLEYLVLGVLLAIAIEGMLRFLRLRSIAWLGSRADHMVSVSIFGRLLHLPPVYTERSSVSAELARIKAFETVRDFFTGPTLLVILELPFTIILLACIAFLAGPIATLPVAMAALYMAMLLYMRPKLRQALWLAAKANSEKEKLLVETFSKIEGMRFNGTSEVWSSRFREVSGSASYGSFRSAFLASVIETMAHGLSILAGVATIAFGVGRIWDGDMTVGALIASLILIWRVLSPFQTVCLMLPRVEQLLSTITQINRLMEIEPERDTNIMTGSRKAFQGRIRFTNVGLRYSKDHDPVFAGLSVEINPGELVAVTGNNGAGKSTVLKLINRLCVPQAGNIRIDGADVRQIDPVELRRNITYVSENPTLFHGTIADNLRLGNPLASDQALKEALIEADGWDEVSALQEQLYTFVGDGKSAGLSSGFAYRLNLARAYLKDSSIMLIDEIPFALLNSSTGEVYKNFLKVNKGKRTVMIVTYRDDYIELADKVILLSPGSRPVVGTQERVFERDKVA